MYPPKPSSPIRDPNQIGPTEDLDREPDGVPHNVVGLAALFSVMLAMLAMAMVLTGPVGRVCAVVLCILAIPVLVSSLRKKSERERDHHHPSL